MQKITDQKYLREQQYKTSSNLSDRINIHLQFSTNVYSWQRWVYDQLVFEPGNNILEIGCGRGDLWKENLDRLPAGGSICIGDLSLGMVQEAYSKLNDISRVTFISTDGQELPFSKNSFDIIIANHMLYHVPDLDAGLEEISRVLKPKGRLYATTIGLGHMKELAELIRLYNPDHPDRRIESMSFILENAVEVLEDYYKSVEMRRFYSDLLVTDVLPLMDYILSSWYMSENEKDAVADLETHLNELINKSGQFFITKSQGMAIASN